MNTSIEIMCSSGFRDALNNLPDNYFNGTVLGVIPSVKVKVCSAPGGGKTFAQLFSKLGLSVSSISVLVVRRSQTRHSAITGGNLGRFIYKYIIGYGRLPLLIKGLIQ